MSSCAEHPEVVAVYQCDGCDSLLCDQCVDEGHALLLCRLCGERALPLAAAAPATVKERKKVVKRDAAAGYGLGDALRYPFRGSGLFMFIAAVISAGAVSAFVYIGSFSIMGCFAFFVWLGWLSLLVGIQFKIVESTVDFQSELPDWPDYYSLGERLVELLTFVVIAGLQWGPAVALVLVSLDQVLTTEPSLFFWLAFAALLWLGTAVGAMAWGGAGTYGRLNSLRVDLHLKALAATGADGIKTVNVIFVLLGVVLVLRSILGNIQIVGPAIAGTLAIYWTFLLPHLVGVLFRRFGHELDRIYA